MTKKKVIAYKNYKTKCPLWSTAICITMLDYWQAPQWLWGIMGGLFFLFWFVYFHGLLTEEDVDIFKNEKI